MIALAAVMRGRRQRGALAMRLTMAIAGGGGAAHRRLWRGGPGVSSHPAAVRAFLSSSRCWARPGAVVVLMGFSPAAILARRRRQVRPGMSWSWTLYRYLAVQFLLGVAVVYARLPGAGLLDRHRRSAEPHRRP